MVTVQTVVGGKRNMGTAVKDPYEGFAKTKDFLICIDSDGCAMDTMDIKHFRCFGPPDFATL